MATMTLEGLTERLKTTHGDQLVAVVLYGSAARGERVEQRSDFNVLVIVRTLTPTMLRATAATLLLDAGVDLVKVQELLGHRHVTTTQIYDKRRRHTSEGASHDMPI